MLCPSFAVFRRMAQLIHTHSRSIPGPDGALYEARVYGDTQRGGTWIGWLEFRRVSAADGPSRPGLLRTGRETTQPDLPALEYWAGGLEPIYLEGAVARARPAD